MFIIMAESTLVGICDHFSRISPFLFLSMSYQYIDTDILIVHIFLWTLCLLDLFCALAFEISHLADWYIFHVSSLIFWGPRNRELFPGLGNAISKPYLVGRVVKVAPQDSRSLVTHSSTNLSTALKGFYSSN